MTKLKPILFKTFIAIALLIIFDFILPGNPITEEVLNVQSQTQQYNNAAGNSHKTYTITTKNRTFYVSPDFAKSDWENKQVNYSISKLFKEVNWYRLESSDSKSYYSLRLVTGLAIPVIFIFILFILNLLNKESDVLRFVLHIVLIGDLIYLCL